MIWNLYDRVSSFFAAFNLPLTEQERGASEAAMGSEEKRDINIRV